MLDRMIEKAREQEVFSREDAPTRRRVLAAFLYHAGLSYRKIEPFGSQRTALAGLPRQNE